MRRHDDAVVFGLAQIVPDPLQLALADQRTGVEIGQRRTDPQSCDGVADARNQLFVDRALDQQAAAGGAGLSAVLHDRIDDDRHDIVETGVGEYDLRRLAAEFERHRAMVLRRRLRDRSSRDGRTGEADVIDARMRCQRSAGLAAIPGDDVERAVGETHCFGASSATRSSERQASSAGLTTQALPAASAAPTLRPKICIG